MTPAGQAARRELDEQLSKGSGDISIAMGVELYRELWVAGAITVSQCRAVGFDHLIDWTMYGHGRFVHYDCDMAPYGFAVGQAGDHTLMPTGPKGQRRPADVIGNAVHIMRIATGEIEDTVPDDGKDPAAKALGKKGGVARAKAMLPERRKEIASQAAAKRWKKG